MNIEERYPERARRQFTNLGNEVQQEMRRAKEPQLRALLKTSAEVLSNLEKTFSAYEMRNEKRWR